MSLQAQLYEDVKLKPVCSPFRCLAMPFISPGLAYCSHTWPHPSPRCGTHRPFCNLSSWNMHHARFEIVPVSTAADLIPIDASRICLRQRTRRRGEKKWSASSSASKAFGTNAETIVAVRLPCQSSQHGPFSTFLNVGCARWQRPSKLC